MKKLICKIRGHWWKYPNDENFVRVINYCVFCQHWYKCLGITDENLTKEETLLVKNYPLMNRAIEDKYK